MKHVDMQGDTQKRGTAPKEINTNGAGTPCSATVFQPPSVAQAVDAAENGRRRTEGGHAEAAMGPVRISRRQTGTTIGILRMNTFENGAINPAVWHSTTPLTTTSGNTGEGGIMPNKHRTPTASAMKSAARRSARSRIEQVRDEGRVKSKELENTKVVVQPTVVAPREEQSEATIADNRINDAGGVAYMEISETSRSTLDHYNWRKCMGEMKKFVKTTESECWQQTKKAFRSLSEDEPETHAALRSALDANKHPLAPFIRGGLDSWTGDHVPVVIPDPLTPLSKAARVLIEELGAAVELDGCSINMTFRSDTRDFAIFQLALDGLAPKYPGGNLHARRLRPVMPLDDRSIAAEFRIDKFHLSDNGLSIYSGDPRNADKVKMFRRNFQPGIFRFTGSGSSKELSLEQMQICDYNCGFLALPQFQFPELLSVYRELEIRGGAAVFMYQDGRSGVDNRTILEIARITKRLGEGAMAAAERQERRVLAMKKQSIGEREATCGALADPPDQMHLNDGGR